jgi:hypothetical protein
VINKIEGGKKSVGARFLASVQTGPVFHSAFYTMCAGSILRGLSGRDVALTIQTNITPRLKKQ